MSNYPQNFWYVAARSGELTDQPLGRTICGESVVMFRAGNEKPVALQDFCPHRGLPLSKGKCEGNGIRCGYHGMLIDGEGQCVSMPNQPYISRAKGVPSYPAAEKYGYVWLWIGDAAEADMALIPDMPWGEGGDWAYGGGMYHIHCDYRLLVDNLMDLTHETFVHPESIGQSEIEESKPEVTVEDGVVKVSRWMLNIKPPPFWAGLIGSDDPVDRWQICHFQAPSNVHIDVGVAAAGTGAPEGERSRGITGLVVDFITPETERSCWYFWGMARDFQLDDAALTERIRQGQQTIFAQDLEILEAQQKNLAGFPDRRLMNLDIDKGGLHSRRIIDRLCQQ